MSGTPTGSGAVANERGLNVSMIHAGGSGIAVFATVLMVFFTQNMVLTLLPISIESSGVATGLVLGLLLAATEGLGVVIAPPVAAWADRWGYPAVLRAGGIVTAVSMTLLGFASLTHSIWLWAIPVLLYAFVRTFTMASTLAVVTGMPRVLRAHGINSMTQRVAAILAAGLTSVAVIGQWWSWGFWLLALSGVALVLFTRRLPVAQLLSQHDAVPMRRSYVVSLSMLGREKALQASSLVGVTNRVLLVTGNAFFALSIGTGMPGLAGWLLLFLLARDLTSVVCGVAFRPLVVHLGLRSTLVLMGGSSVAGLLIIGLFEISLLSVILGAMLQGVGIFIAIGTTNLLATNNQQGGRALRLTSTFYLGSVAALIFPALLGLALDEWGGKSVFVVSAGIVAGVMIAVIVLARKWTRASAQGSGELL